MYLDFRDAKFVRITDMSEAGLAVTYFPDAAELGEPSVAAHRPGGFSWIVPYGYGVTVKVGPFLIGMRVPDWSVYQDEWEEAIRGWNARLEWKIPACEAPPVTRSGRKAKPLP